MFSSQYSVVKSLAAAALLYLSALLPTWSCGSELIIEEGDTVAFLGDSITAGGEGYGGYCRLVIHGLKARGVSVKGVFAGVPGDKSSDMLLRLDSVLSQHPNVLFLSAGVNDIWHGDPTVKIGVFQAQPGMGVDFENYKIYIKEILDRCARAGVKVILSTITPITEDPEFKLNKRSEEYNAFIHGQAQERGLPIAKLHEEMFARIAALKAEQGTDDKRNVLTSDGVHPTEPGHQVMAKGILRAMGLPDEDLDALEKEWNSSPTILIVGDRQVNAGARTGGWVHMLLDGLNMGREMVTASTVADRSTCPLAKLLPRLGEAVEDGRTKYMLLVPPIGDVQEKTPTDEYRKVLGEVVDFAEAHKLKLAVAVIPVMMDDGSESEFNANVRAYNMVINDLCRERKVAVAGMRGDASEYSKAEQGVHLAVGDARLNHQGGMMLAESVLEALMGYTKQLVGLRAQWDRRASYTFRYSGSVSADIPITESGAKALREISERYHKLDEMKFLDLGVHLLLQGDPGANDVRIGYFDREWLGAGDSAEVRTFRAAAESAVQLRAINEYMATHDIDREEFYRRAYKAGMFVMRKEDPLGRGSY